MRVDELRVESLELRVESGVWSVELRKWRTAFPGTLI
jgi:hypothetical protein